MAGESACLSPGGGKVGRERELSGVGVVDPGAAGAFLMTRYDLSQPVEAGQVGYPDDPETSLTEHASLAEDGYRVTALSMSTHTGTHVDVPAHTERDGWTVGDYQVEEFCFHAVRLDLRDNAPRDPIRRDDLQAAAAQVSPDETFAADMVVLWTGWPEYRGGDWYRDHPFLTPEAAGWLADNGYHVAIDALSVDPTPSPNSRPDEPDGLPAHHELLGRGQFIVENLANLGGPPESFRLEAYPIALPAAEAAPARAVAVIGE